MTALQTTTTDMEEIEPTEWAYQSGLEATAAERRLESKEAIWEADEDWQAFRTLCYPDPGPPSQEEIAQGLQHLYAAVARGNADAQYRLATILFVGHGHVRLKRDLSRAASLYQAAIEGGHPTATWQLAVLQMINPAVDDAWNGSN